MKKLIPVKDVLICVKNPDPTRKYSAGGLVGYTKIESVPTYKITEVKVFDSLKWPCQPQVGQSIVVSSTPTAVNFGDGSGTVYLITPDQILGTIVEQ